MDNPQIGDELNVALENPEKLRRLPKDKLDRLMHSAICLYGATGKPDLADTLLPAYEIYQETVHPAQRLRNYQEIVDRILEGDVGLHALLTFLCGDIDQTIASTAALDYAALCPVEGNDPLEGTREILSLVAQNLFRNPFAVIGGLLMTGDRRVLELIAPIRPTLTCAETELLIQCRGSMLTAALVDFYLDWLEETDSSENADIFGAVAAGLANLALTVPDQTVYDIERIFPSSPDNAVNVLEKWTFADYARLIEPRLRTLAVKECGEPVLPQVIEAWGLPPYPGN